MRVATMQRLMILVLSAALLVGTKVGAQTLAPPELPAEYQKVVTDYSNSQTGAQRSGDERLGCGEPEKQMIAVVNDPAMRAYAKSTASMAQNAAARQSSAQATTGMGQTKAQQMQMAQNQQQLAAQMKGVEAVMPKMIRVQRLAELAEMKNCGWLARFMTSPESAVLRATPDR
jgi:hypothetical protein